MNEVYRGNREDRQYIATYLRNIRSLYPDEIFTLKRVVALSEIGSSKNRCLIDQALFWGLAKEAARLVHHEYSPRFHTLKPSRYFFGIPDSPEKVGGFHSRYSVGYHYFYHAALTTLLNPQLIESIYVRTVEAVRNFLHDSMHHSTFVTFRRAKPIPKTREEAKRSLPQVYREQYGINFRNSEGLSYSNPNLTERVPHAINLNLLMDGVIVTLVSSLLKRLVETHKPGNLTPIEREVLNEVIQPQLNGNPQTRGYRFFAGVTKPSQVFVQHWGGDEFLKLIFRAMMHGNLARLKKCFSEKYGENGAWEKVFKQPNFKL